MIYVHSAMQEHWLALISQWRIKVVRAGEGIQELLLGAQEPAASSTQPGVDLSFFEQLQTWTWVVQVEL